MTGPLLDRDLQALWQSQSSREDAISLDVIRQRAQHLERRVSRRNRREYVAAAVVVGGYGWMMFVGSSITIRIGAGLAVAAAIVIAYNLHRRGAASPLPSELGLSSARDFHRAQLERQRDLLRSVWWWGLLPLAPSFLVLQIGQALGHPERISGLVAVSVLVIVVMVGIYELNRRAAAGIQRRIDQLKENL
jgi:hypothetical protein